MENLISNQGIYLDKYLRLYRSIQDIIINQDEYYLVSSFDDLNFEEEKPYLVLGNENIAVKAIFNDEIKARSYVLLSLENYIKIIKNNASMVLKSGYDINENIIGNIYLNGYAYKCFNASIQKSNDSYCVTINYSNEIVFALYQNYINIKYLNSSLIKNEVAIITSDEEKEGMKSYIEEIIKNLGDIFVPSKKLSLKEKYNALENEFINIIVLINHSCLKKGTVKIKNLLKNEDSIVTVNNITAEIDSIIKNNKIDAYKAHFATDYNYFKNQGITKVCSLKHLDSESFDILVPFNQRLKKEKCDCCDNEAKFIVMKTNKRK